MISSYLQIAFLSFYKSSVNFFRLKRMNRYRGHLVKVKVSWCTGMRDTKISVLKVNDVGKGKEVILPSQRS